MASSQPAFSKSPEINPSGAGASDNAWQRLLQVCACVGNISWLKPDGSNFADWLGEVELSIKCLVGKQKALSSAVTLDPIEDRIVHDLLRCSVDPVHRPAIYRASDSMAAFRSLSALFQSRNRATQVLVWHQILSSHFDPLGSESFAAHSAKMANLFDQLELAGFGFSRDALAGMFLQLSLPVQRGGPFEHLNRAIELRHTKDGPISFTDVIGSATDELANFKLGTLASPWPAAVPASPAAPSTGQEQPKPGAYLPVQYLAPVLAHPAEASSERFPRTPPSVIAHPSHPCEANRRQADGPHGNHKPPPVDPLPSSGQQSIEGIGQTLKTTPYAHDLSLQEASATDGDRFHHPIPPAQCPKSSDPHAKPPKPLAQHLKPSALAPEHPCTIEGVPSEQQAVASGQSILAQLTETSIVAQSAVKINADHQSADPVRTNSCGSDQAGHQTSPAQDSKLTDEALASSTLKLSADEKPEKLVEVKSGGASKREPTGGQRIKVPDMAQPSSSNVKADAEQSSEDSATTISWASDQASRQTSPAQHSEVSEGALAESTVKLNADEKTEKPVEGKSGGASKREPTAVQRIKESDMAQPSSSNVKGDAEHSSADSARTIPWGSDQAGHQTLPAQHSKVTKAAPASSTTVEVSAHCNPADLAENKSGGAGVSDPTVGQQAKVFVSAQPTSYAVEAGAEQNSVASAKTNGSGSGTSCKPTMVERSQAPIAAQASSSKINDERLSAGCGGATIVEQSTSAFAAQAASSYTFGANFDGQITGPIVNSPRRLVRRLPVRAPVVPPPILQYNSSCWTLQSSSQNGKCK